MRQFPFRILGFHFILRLEKTAFTVSAGLLTTFLEIVVLFGPSPRVAQTVCG